MCVMKKGKHKSDTEIIILYKTICDVFWAWDILNNEGWAGVYRDVQSQRMLPEGFLVEQILMVCQLLKESWIGSYGSGLPYRL